MNFADRLRQSRKNNNISQEQLADKLDVSRQTITKWESGAGFPEMKKAISLAALLRVSLDWLYENELSDLGWNPNLEKNELGLNFTTENQIHQKHNVEIIKNAVASLYNPSLCGDIPTGIRCLDSVNGGFCRGFVYYLLGRPCIGKFPFAVNIVVNYLRDNRTVMFALKEHTANSLLKTAIAIDANVNSYQSHADYTVDDNGRVRKTAKFLESANLIIDDCYDESIDKLFEKCNNYCGQLDLVVIDSARLLHPATVDKNPKTNERSIKRVIDNIARECRCAVLVIDRFDEEVEKSLLDHNNAKEVVKQLTHRQKLYDGENLIIFHRQDYYQIRNSDISYISIIYNDGYHGKGIKYLSCRMDMKTGRVLNTEKNNPMYIIDEVSLFYEIPSNRIIGSERIAEIVRARQVAIYICKELGMPTKDICKCFGSRDHSTIIYSHVQIQEALKNEPELESEIKMLMSRFKYVTC